MSEYVADTETDGLLPDLTQIHSLVLKDTKGQIAESCTVNWRNTSYAPIERGLEMLRDAELVVFHNGIKFDIPAIQKVYPTWAPKGLVRDTLVLSRLLKADLDGSDMGLVKKGRLPPQMKGRHGLEAWGYRLGKWKGDYAEIKGAEAKAKGIKGAAEIARYVWSTWNPEMQSYCEQDVEVTLALWNYFQKLIAEQPDLADAVKDPIGLEHDVSWIIGRQERRGVGFNVQKAVKLYATLKGHQQRLEDTLQQSFKPKELRTTFTPKVNNKKQGYVKGVPIEKVKIIPFNPGSRQQVAERLLEMGWEPQEYGKDGIPSIDDETLQLLPYAEAKPLAEYQVVKKRIGSLSTGKKSLMKAEVAGRIHGGVNTCGTPTARMTHADPNLAQVPAVIHKKTGELQAYGKEMRELFEAATGFVLVGCDADSLELRDLAGYMARYDGGAYIETVLKGRKEDGTDMHTLTSKIIGSSRSAAKTWFYAFIYGAGDYKLGLILSGTGSVSNITAIGKRSRMRFMKGLPALGKIDEAAKTKAKAQGYLKGIDGRRIYIRSQHSALNFLLQSAGAIQMKRALVILDRNLQAAGLVPGVDYEFVLNVHDEWQIEVKEELAQQVKEMAPEAIRLAGEFYSFRCPLKGNADIGKNWADTH